MRENPPVMVLFEETSELVTFRFRGNRWALATLVPGLLLACSAGYLYLSNHPSHLLLGMLGSFGVLLLYSTVYSATSNQWLTANGTTRNITFHKKNIYGLMHWEKPPIAFERIEVYKQGRSQNWLITLVLTDGYRVFVGENAFGAFSQERALKIARKVAERTGLRIETSPKLFY